MTGLFDAIMILLLIVFAVFANIIYLLIYNILTEKGFKAPWFRGHVNNLLEFSDLASKTENAGDKRYYKNLLRTYLLFIVLFIGTVAIFLFNSKRNPCETYNDFLAIEVSGEVIDKFEDRPNHNYPTLTLQTKDGRTNDILLSLHNNGLFDSVRAGDFATKTKGDSITYLKRSDNRIIAFMINRTDYCDEE